MKRIFNKAGNKKKAEEWDIIQQISMTADERLAAARELQRRVFGAECPDIRQAEKNDQG